MNKLEARWKKISPLAKVAAYSALIGLLASDLAYANLDEQVDKVSDLILGKVAAVVVGGGLACGGGYSIVSGNVMKGLAQLGIAILIGIGLALAKAGTIFEGL